MRHLLAFAAALLFAAGLSATNINFELGGPCNFGATSPLTAAYAGQGVTFSGGGAVLNECSNFSGLSAHSGTDFLAFNTTTYAVGPETMTFSSPATNISIYVGATGGSTYQLTAFDSGGNQLGSASVTPSSGWELMAINASNISSAVLSFSSSWGVADDLTFNAGAVPEPATSAIAGLGLAIVAALRRRRA